MAEVLTESFCERCGTRYTFESAQPRAKRLKGVKVLSRGLKNFVLSDDSSLDEAMAAARSDTDREITSQQLDAFHQTFNFCMTCRQYTCANCWNEAEGSCLTCSPHLGREILPAPFPDLDPAAGMTLVATDAANGNGNGHEPAAAAAGGFALGAWPASDLVAPDDADGGSLEVIDDVEPVDAAARLAALTAVEPIESAAEPDLQAAASAPDIPQPEVVAANEPETVAPSDATPTAPAVEAPAAETDHVAAAAAAQTAALLHRFRPGQNLDAEIEAYEREQAERDAAAESGAAPEAIVAAAVTHEVVEDVAAEPIAEAVAAEAVAEAEAAPAAEAEAEAAPDDDARPDDDAAAAAAAVALAAAARRTDVVEQPTWQIVAPDVEAPAVAAPPVVPPIAPTTNGTPPEWPARPEWPAQAQATNGLPFLGRPAQPTGGLDSLWAESNREVVSAPLAPGRPAAGGVQPCVSCGLSLSATARFCRRCGTSQVA